MPAVPPQFVARVNYKPMSAADVRARFNPEKVLRDVRREILKSIRNRIKQEAFSPEAKKALSRGLKTKLGPNSLTIIATHPAFLPLIRGQKSGQMRWLRRSPTPIPIVTDSGKVIFRSASAKSMNDGRWIHPGHKPTRIIEIARKEARAIVKKRMKKELVRQFREGMAST
jgi:hypothetical protein